MKKRIISILMALVMALSLLPAGALAAGLPFTDVKTSDWFYNDVKNAYDKGLINGKTATTFEPNSNLTYAEAVKLAACMNQRNATGMVTLVNGNPWYATYVGYAQDNGIISKDYDWNAKATRAGYMEIFANALPAANLKPVNNVPDGSIPDVPMSHPQADAIYTLYRAGILQGSDAEHNCKPSDNIKRSEVSAILTRMMDSTARITFSMGEIPEELTIISQPANVACAVGDTAVFSVGVTGGKEAYKYQWQGYSISARKYLSIVGGTSATLSLAVKDENTYKDVSKVRCVVTDADGVQVTSNEATLTQAKVDAPTITAQPQDVTCAVGDKATFKVTASGGKAPYKYQWEGRGPLDKNFLKLPGKTSDTLEITADDTIAEVRCVITDANGSSVTTSAAKLTKSPTVTPLRIITQPVNVTGKSGDSVSFTVVASGGKASYTYQWQVKDYYQDWENVNTSWIASAKSATLSFRVHQEEFENEYQYRCVVTDADGNKATSNAVKVIKVETTVPLKITDHPIDVTCTVPEGDKLNRGFVVIAEGGAEPYTYQWQYRQGTGIWKDASTLSWANAYETQAMVITVYNGTFDWDYSFRCIVTDANGTSVTSNAAYLYEGAAQTTPLTIKTQPQNVTCSVGDTVSFEVDVSGGTPGYVYEWQFKTSSLSSFAKLTTTDTTTTGQGTNKITLKVNKNHFVNGTVFKCVIKDAKGNTVTTNVVTLKAKPLSVRVSCNGANAQQGAMLRATVTGGAAPYTYKWDTGTTTTTNATYHTIWVGKGKGGTCTVTDANGTTVSATVQYDPNWFRP